MDKNRNHNQNLRQNIFKAGLFSIVLLATLFSYVTYLQVVNSDSLAFHPLNKRSIEASRKIQRGQITDRQGIVIASSMITAKEQYEREYPYRELFAHAVGYTSEKYGNAGIESIYNGYLSGQINPERRLGAISQLFVGEAGNNITLTLDTGLQQAAYKALAANRGAVVIIAPKTGAVLAMVSRPSFDPARLETDWNSISQSDSSPLLNRVTQGLYPPGSIIKIMMAETALAAKLVDAKREFSCTGLLRIGPDYTLNESGNRAHGKIDLEQALAVSCNVTFGRLALELGHKKMADSFERYGFNRQLNGDIIESPGKLPNFSSLGDGDLAQTGIGQGSLLVTPLRMAMLVAAFANKGIMMKPYLVQKITTPDGAIVRNTLPEKWRSPIEAELAGQVANMMVTVVNQGTGRGAAIRGIEVAGKTGTAENPHGASHAWFIGFAPVDDPQVAIAVIAENAGSGGGVAAPVAREILVQALRKGVN